jgi:hypothetical protein
MKMPTIQQVIQNQDDHIQVECDVLPSLEYLKKEELHPELPDKSTEASAE